MRMRRLFLMFLGFAMGILLWACDAQNDHQASNAITITFDSMGGEALEPITIEPHEPYELPTPSKEGKTFLGWYTSLEGDAERFESDSDITNNITLYARWLADHHTYLPEDLFSRILFDFISNQFKRGRYQPEAIESIHLIYYEMFVEEALIEGAHYVNYTAYAGALLVEYTQASGRLFDTAEFNLEPDQLYMWYEDVHFSHHNGDSDYVRTAYVEHVYNMGQSGLAMLESLGDDVGEYYAEMLADTVDSAGFNGWLDSQVIMEENDVLYVLIEEELAVLSYPGMLDYASIAGPEDVVIPASIEGWPVTSIYPGAFHGSLIRSVVIPYSVRTIGARAFYFTRSLRTVTIEANSQLSVIDKEAFRFARFTHIELPEGLLEIREDAFSNVPLSSVIIPKSVIMIEAGAFKTIQSESYTIYIRAESPKEGWDEAWKGDMLEVVWGFTE